MKKIFAFVMLSLLLASCGGNSSGTEMPLTGGNGGVNGSDQSQGGAGPKFDFSFYWQYTGVVENGMKEVQVFIIPHNASNSYYRLDLGPFGDSRCEWDAFGDNDLPRPALTTMGTDFVYTSEGFKGDPYSNALCLRREIEFFPPGAAGWLFEFPEEGFFTLDTMFQIPENATPDEVTVNYEYSDFSQYPDEGETGTGTFTGKAEEAASWNGFVYRPDPGVVDLYELGEAVPIGSLAEFSFMFNRGTGVEQTLLVDVTNRHEGYPITLDLAEMSIWSNDGIYCCNKWLWIFDTVGPKQTQEFSADFQGQVAPTELYLFMYLKVSVQSGETVEHFFAIRIPPQQQ